MGPVLICQYLDRLPEKFDEWDSLIDRLPDSHQTVERNLRQESERQIRELPLEGHENYLRIEKDLGHRYQQLSEHLVRLQERVAHKRRKQRSRKRVAHTSTPVHV